MYKNHVEVHSMWFFLCLKIEIEKLKLQVTLIDMIYLRGIVRIFRLRLVK